jgi:hypothetical protein
MLMTSTSEWGDLTRWLIQKRWHETWVIYPPGLNTPNCQGYVTVYATFEDARTAFASPADRPEGILKP